MDGNEALCYKINISFWGLKPPLSQIFGYCLKACFVFWKLLLLFLDALSFERLALPSLKNALNSCPVIVTSRCSQVFPDAAHLQAHCRLGVLRVI